MSRSNSPETLTGSWPLLQLLGTRTALFENGTVLDFPGTPAFPPDLLDLLEAEELTSARTRALSTRNWPGPPGGSLWEQAAAAALRGGGIRVHDPFNLGIQVQAFCQPDPPVPVLYVGAPFQELAVRNRSADAGEPAVTVWFNPVGDVALPHAAEEAREIYAIIASRLPDARFVARALGSGEARMLLAESDVMIYFGHGRILPGTIGIPCADSLLPLAGEVGRSPAPRDGVLIFGGCVENKKGAIETSVSCALMPCCRIADRPSRFLTNVVSGWVSGSSLPHALRSAMATDLAAGDFRWRAYRSMGESQLSGRPLAG